MDILNSRNLATYLQEKDQRRELGKKVRREIVEGVVNQRVRGPVERGRTRPEIVCIGDKL